MRRNVVRDVLVVVAVAVLYVACARLGFAFAIRAAQVTTVWPPTGFALAAVFRFRGIAAAGVFLGAFVANAMLDEPLLVAAAIAAGNTLEAVFGAALLRRLNFEARMRRVRDVLSIIITAISAPLVSATIGVLALTLGGVQPMSSAPGLWGTWWIGDVLGAMTVGAPLLVWSAGDPTARRRAVVLETIVMLAALFAACLFVFSLPARTAAIAHVVYVFFIWAALRLGPAPTATAVLVASAVAVWGTDAGRGPFAGAGPERGLVLLQFFTGVATTTGMMLAAVAAQYRDAESVLRAEGRRKDEFLAMLGHELRNPLAPILHAADLLDGNHDLAAVIRRQTRQLARLVDDLLDVSRINSGKIRIETKPVTVADVVSNAVETWQHLIDIRRQTLTVDIPQERLWINADPARITQVLANLVHNASKFTPERGDITVAAAAHDQQVKIVVRDSGAGMTADMVEHAFDLFVQGPPPIDRPLGGLGLGLTLARRLVELHGGRLTAASAGPGKGCEFTIELPAAAAPDVVTEASPPAASKQKRRVLVVEDHIDTRTMLMFMLRRLGHDARGAADGQAALIEAKRFEPQVVLLDIGLPQMDGYAVAKQLREMPETANAMLIAVTGYGMPADRERSREARIDHHLLKPIDPATLSEIIV